MLVTLSVPEDARRRRDRRPQLAPRAARWAWSRTARMTEIKAEVPMAEMLDLRARPALDHRRPRRLHDGVPALRGGPGAPRAEGGRAGGRGGPRLVTPGPEPMRRGAACAGGAPWLGDGEDQSLLTTGAAAVRRRLRRRRTMARRRRGPEPLPCGAACAGGTRWLGGGEDRSLLANLDRAGGTHERHPHEPARHRLRRLRPHAAAR